MTSQPLFQNNFILRRPGVAISLDIVKTVTFFIKIILQKVKIIRNCIKMQSIHLFLDIARFDDLRWKIADVSRSQGLCHMIHIFFKSFLGKV